MSAERERVARFGRLEDGLLQAGDWYRWGPYVSERQWGTVREDYSADGNAWEYLPHDHARSRAYRWGEDGLAGFCDIQQRLCLALALWNGRDPILRERTFGLTNPQGNHGEDVKECWWYLDAVHSHAWNRWRYRYPQAAFPYQDLIDVNAARDRYQFEYELLDTGVLDGDRYWITEVCYAKAGPDDLLMAIQVTNAGPEASTLHVLPTAWLRNTWSWDATKPGWRCGPRATSRSPSTTRSSAPWNLSPPPHLTGPARSCCSARTRPTSPGCTAPTRSRPFRRTASTTMSSAAPAPSTRTAPAPNARSGTGSPSFPGRPPNSGSGCGPLPPGQPAPEACSAAGAPAALGAGFDQVMATRRAEADEFYAELTPAGADADEAMALRQACAGLLWGKQLYYYAVSRWLDGDPAQPVPPRRSTGRTCRRATPWSSPTPPAGWAPTR
jgi:hypothetical protein